MRKKTIETENIPHDLEYQILLTQRSIARAALHLGIDTLPSNTLTVLQDALTQYIERVGRVMANHVENSGRSSHHVNVLDAIRAVEDCALVAAVDTSLSSPSEEGGQQPKDSLVGYSGEWEDLVKFLYGSVDVLHSKGAVPGPRKRTGSILIQDDHVNPMSSSSVGGSGSSSGKEEHGMGVGWYAPLDDYDSIPFFPVELRNKDPQHSSGSRDSFKRKRGDNDDENVSFEENMFVSRKRMKNNISQQQQQQPGTNAPKGQGSKERKQGSANFMSQHQDISENTQRPSLPSYVPNFLPPFPPKHTYTKSITLPKPVPMDEFRAQNVRSSLVQLGRSYWGALPVSKDTHVDRDGSSSSSSRGVFVKVKTEPLDVSALASESVDVGAGGVEMKGGGVKPIVRASATRFSKILEGSMDVH